MGRPTLTIFFRKFAFKDGKYLRMCSFILCVTLRCALTSWTAEARQQVSGHQPLVEVKIRDFFSCSNAPFAIALFSLRRRGCWERAALIETWRRVFQKLLVTEEFVTENVPSCKQEITRKEAKWVTLIFYSKFYIALSADIKILCFPVYYLSCITCREIIWLIPSAPVRSSNVFEIFFKVHFVPEFKFTYSSVFLWKLVFQQRVVMLITIHLQLVSAFSSAGQRPEHRKRAVLVERLGDQRPGLVERQRRCSVAKNGHFQRRRVLQRTRIFVAVKNSPPAAAACRRCRPRNKARDFAQRGDGVYGWERKSCLRWLWRMAGHGRTRH